MNRFAIIENGHVANTVVADAEFAAEQGWIYAPTAALGDEFQDGVFIAMPQILPTPTSVSPRQIRQALTLVGLRARVEDAVAHADQGMRDWYEFSSEFERAHPEVARLAALLAVTDAQLDDLWRLAASL